MADNIHLEIVTPKQVAYSKAVDSVVISGIEGDMEIFKDHISLITFLKAGKIIAKAYKAVEPNANPISNNNDPRNVPKIKPAAMTTGKPKPSKKNQIVQNKKNEIEERKIFSLT